MDASVNRFIRALRGSGVRVSPAESIDALRALACVRIVDREATYAALRSTLLKTIREAPLFDALFALFFGPPTAAAANGDDSPAPAAGTAEVPSPPAARQVVLDTDDDGINLSGDSGEAGTTDTLRLKPGGLEDIARNLRFDRADALLDPVMQRAAQTINVRGASAGARPGELACDETAPTLDADLLLAALDLLADDVADGDVDSLAARHDQVRAALERLPDALREALERRLSEQQERSRRAADAPRRSTAQRFTELERRDMDAMVRRLGRRMRGERSYVRHVGAQGRVHVARTVRASMRFDGIPFRPVVTRQIADAPRLVVICDVSQSVRTTARFTLLLVYSLQACFAQVRSFVFVSDLAEASPLFDRHGIDEAIDAVFSGALIDCEANSNYGRALEMFARRHLSAINSQTTVVVLGDGRGNRNPPNVGALEEIRRRAKQLVWLSPEPRGSWGLGSSDMPLYAPVCHRTEVVRNLAQLGTVADGLFRRGWSGGGNA